MIDDLIVLSFKDPEIEKQVLGTFMLYPNSFTRVAHLMNERMFTIIENRIVFRSIVKLVNESKPVDIITVSHETKNDSHAKKLIKENEWNVSLHVSMCTNEVIHDKNLEEHINILAGLLRNRELCNLLISNGQKLNKGDDPEEIIQSIQSDLTKIELVADDEYDEITEVTRMLKELESKESNFIKSHIQELDDVIQGWEPNDFVIVAGAPGMGKTALALQIFLNQIFNSTEAAFFSLEMSQEQLFRRMISMETKIPNTKIRNRQLTEYDWELIHKFTSKITGKSRWIIDDKSTMLTDVVSKIRKCAIKDKVKVIIIDYLQLIVCNTKKTGTREQEVSTITRTLKQLATELKIVIVGLSQVSRSIEQRENKRPRLSDLRESGAIEQDADMVLFTFRPDYYIITEVPKSVQEVELIIAKGRHTGTGMALVNFVPVLTKYIAASEARSYD